MKKSLLVLAMVFAFVAFSCSSDDDNNVSQEEITLVGEWRLTNVDFTVMEEGGRPASDACIVELVAGYEFRADNKFYFILGEGGFFDPYAQDYWEWTGDINDFEIVQTNLHMPPYNFGLNPTNIQAEWVDGVATLTFHSEMGNGSAANFTLIKEAIDETKLPELTDPEGESYYCGFFDPEPLN